MNSIVQIVRQRIWWILLALVIAGLFFFRHSIFGFKEGVAKKPKPMNTVKKPTPIKAVNNRRPNNANKKPTPNKK